MGFVMGFSVSSLQYSKELLFLVSVSPPPESMFQPMKSSNVIEFGVSVDPGCFSDSSADAATSLDGGGGEESAGGLHSAAAGGSCVRESA